MLTEQATEFLKARGLDAGLAARLGIHSVSRRGTADWIAMPYMVNGVAVNHKYRRITEKQFEQDSGGKQVFYNQDCLQQNTMRLPVVICEGELDCAATISVGYKFCVSVPNGAPSKEMGDKDTDKYSYLDNAMKLLADVREIILATDGDAPGICLMNDLALRLGKERCKWIKYPIRRNGEGRCKDMNEVLLEYGEKGVKAVLGGAQWVQTDGVYRMSELPPIEAAPVYTIGMQGVDDLYKIRKGDLCVLTGFPGYGKSTFINDVACRMAEHHNWRIAFASFEQTPQTDHLRSLRTWKHRGDPRYARPEDLAEIDEWVDEHFRFIVPSDDDFANIEWLMARCAMSVTQHSVDMIVIDPWNELEHGRNRDQSTTEYVGASIKALRKMARRLNIHLVVAAHPAKPIRSGDGLLKVPDLYDISDSAHWRNKADLGIVVHRTDSTSPQTEIHNVKSRYHDIIGKPGMVTMLYTHNDRRFTLDETAQDPDQTPF